MGKPALISAPEATGSELRRAVFLDRDGVLNRAVVRNGKPYPPGSLDDFELLPGVVEGCRLLKEAGFLLIVATNQPDVGRGTQEQSIVESMHRALGNWLPLDAVEVCYDRPDDQPGFLKPAPGMLLQAAESHGIDLAKSFMIGDRWRDVDCGQAAGCTTIFIECGYSEVLRKQPHHIVRDFSQAVDLVLRARSGEGGQIRRS